MILMSATVIKIYYGLKEYFSLLYFHSFLIMSRLGVMKLFIQVYHNFLSNIGWRTQRDGYKNLITKISLVEQLFLDLLEPLVSVLDSYYQSKGKIIVKCTPHQSVLSVNLFTPELLLYRERIFYRKNFSWFGIKKRTL